MSAIQKRTVSLPQEHASFIDQLVQSGAYGSASEVVRAGLRALQERDSAVERWLHDEVARTYDEVMASPDRVVPAETVRERLRARHVERYATEQ
jgi:antitoxin ParD1/3/4